MAFDIKDLAYDGQQRMLRGVSDGNLLAVDDTTLSGKDAEWRIFF